MSLSECSAVQELRRELGSGREFPDAAANVAMRFAMRVDRLREVFDESEAEGV